MLGLTRLNLACLVMMVGVLVVLGQPQMGDCKFADITTLPPVAPVTKELATITPFHDDTVLSFGIFGYLLIGIAITIFMKGIAITGVVLYTRHHKMNPSNVEIV
ncbi:unnamed protein product [Orchesella dallaii]|uniref:Uncharacterized protein n=1 Tax=Orchesella dallaii TaxID=48710 RepID=A0ABP1PZU2_9HEXA